MEERFTVSILHPDYTTERFVISGSKFKEGFPEVADFLKDDPWSYFEIHGMNNEKLKVEKSAISDKLLGEDESLEDLPGPPDRFL